MVRVFLNIILAKLSGRYGKYKVCTWIPERICFVKAGYAVFNRNIKGGTRWQKKSYYIPNLFRRSSD